MMKKEKKEIILKNTLEVVLLCFALSLVCIVFSDLSYTGSGTIKNIMYQVSQYSSFLGNGDSEDTGYFSVNNTLENRMNVYERTRSGDDVIDSVLDKYKISNNDFSDDSHYPKSNCVIKKAFSILKQGCVEFDVYYPLSDGYLIKEKICFYGERITGETCVVNDSFDAVAFYKTVRFELCLQSRFPKSDEWKYNFSLFEDSAYIYGDLKELSAWVDDNVFMHIEKNDQQIRYENFENPEKSMTISILDNALSSNDMTIALGGLRNVTSVYSIHTITNKRNEKWFVGENSLRSELQSIQFTGDETVGVRKLFYPNRITTKETEEVFYYDTDQLLAYKEVFKNNPIEKMIYTYVYDVDSMKCYETIYHDGMKLPSGINEYDIELNPFAFVPIPGYILANEFIDYAYTDSIFRYTNVKNIAEEGKYESNRGE